MNESEKLVSIIILNYNAGELLINCVDSVFRSDYNNFEVIVVDNNSADNSHLKCKEKFQKIQLIENKENYGYCEGNNIGIRKASGEYIIILNPDTIVEPKWIKELIFAYQNNGDGLYQPKILSLDNKEILQSTGNMLHLFGFGYARDKGIRDDNSRNQIEKIGFASGTCLFTSSRILKKIGLLDSFLFLYHDDLDLGWRASQIGINSYFVPSSIIYHAESYFLKWSAKKFYWLERNRKYCLLTHFSKKTRKKMALQLNLVNLLVWLYYLSKGFFIAKLRADLDILKNKKTIEERYAQLENKKTVFDKEILNSFSDEIFVPEIVVGSKVNQWFNSIISRLSQNAKNNIRS